ncbi:MAG TPA: HAMP domain-containing sensor histidine kinase [Flavobacterium sp.]|jgi:nitrogen fixation/metabolism regulation signal transduction histidine kinase
MKFYNALFLRIFFIIALTGLGLFLTLKPLPYSGILVGLVTFVFLAELYFFIRSRIVFFDKKIQSILQNDFSSSFPKAYRSGSSKSLYQLYERMRSTNHEQLSREQIYTSILNNVDTAVLILQGKPNDWNIFLMNDHFSTLFKVPKFSRWEYLRNQLPAFCDEIERSGFNEMKASVTIRIEDQEQQAFIVQTSLTTSFGTDYYIILLDSIQRVIEKKEKEAWINLMKVISHELMNSLTPIRSLSQSLTEIVNQEQLLPDDLTDIRQSLGTIINRSDHLQHFVDNYRKLTMLPTPDKKAVNVTRLVEECIRIMLPLLRQEHIQIVNEVSFQKSVEADKHQLEQVLINLLTNSIYALKDKSDKVIYISSSSVNNRLFLTISDTGKGVEKEIRDKIFLPFFTTRKDGAGIGLTLSKNIIEAHGGYLSYQSDDEKTSFVICLIY